MSNKSINTIKLNSGIEFGATYFIMLLSLFFTGAGRYLSLDYWIGTLVLEDPAAMLE